MFTLVPDENSMEDPLCNSSFGSMVSLDYVTPDTGGNEKRQKSEKSVLLKEQALGSNQSATYAEVGVEKITEGNVDPWEFLEAVGSDNSNPTQCLKLRENRGEDVKKKPPNTENSLQYGYDENDKNNMSDETKCETNYSIITKWNDVNTHTLHAAHKAQQVHQ